MARYSLIMRDLVYTAIVQYGANLDPPKTFGKLANEILSEWAAKIPEYRDLIRDCYSCAGHDNRNLGICGNRESRFFNKDAPLKRGCKDHVKKE